MIDPSTLDNKQPPYTVTQTPLPNKIKVIVEATSSAMSPKTIRRPDDQITVIGHTLVSILNHNCLQIIVCGQRKLL